MGTGTTRGPDFYDMSEKPYRASRMMKAFGNPKAYALVELLLERGTMNVEEMVRLLNRSKPAVSKILRSLRDLEIVRYQHQANVVLYTLKSPETLRDILRRSEAYIVEAAGMVGGAQK